MTFRVAFYGVSRPAQPYLEALRHRPDILLTAVCDPDRRAAEQTAAGWGARVFQKPEAMLQDARPDALWICVRPLLFGEVLFQAIELNIPFFVDPPGAVDYPQARQYAHSIPPNLVTALGFSARYADVAQEARQYLGANPIPLALGWWLCPPAEDALATAENLLWTEACQFVDLFRYFAGEVDRVRALTTRVGSTEGGLVIQLEFAGGTVGLLTCSTFARPEPRVELEFMGEGWSLGFGEKLSTLRLAERDKVTLLRCLNQPPADHATAFLAAITANDPRAVAASYTESANTLAVCHAALLSARENRPVTLAEIFGENSAQAARSTPSISEPQKQPESDA